MKLEKATPEKPKTEQTKRKWEPPLLNKKDIKETLNNSGSGGDINGRAS
jgi:ribosomal protein L28